MSNAGTPLTSTLSAASANVVSAFTAAGGNGMTLAGLFQNLLASAENSQQQWTKAQTAAGLTGAASAGTNQSAGMKDGNASAASSLAEAMHEVMAALRNFDARWNSSHAQSGANSQRNTTASAATSVTASGNVSGAPSATGATAAAADQPNQSDETAAANGAAAGQASDAGADQTPTLAQLATELQAVLNMIQKNLQTAAGAANVASATTASSGTTAGDGETPAQATLQNLLAAGAALGELLALAQKLEKKSGPASPDDADATTAAATTAAASGTAADTTASLSLAAATAAVPAASTPPTAAGPATHVASDNAETSRLAAIDTQLKNDLQNLIGDLKAAVASAAPAATPATTGAVAASGRPDVTANADALSSLLGKRSMMNAATAPSITADASADVATTAARSDAAASPPAVNAGTIIKNALAAADDVVKQLTGLYPPVAVPAAPTPLPAATAASAGITLAAERNADSGLDADTDANNGGNADLAGSGAAGLTSAIGDTPKTTGLYSFASQLSEARAQNGGMTGLPGAVEQVLLQINRGARDGNDQMTLQLHPADLGSINVKLDFAHDGAVTGLVTASNPDTLAALQKDSRSLERALQDAGLQADPGSLQFSLGDPSGQSNRGQTGNGFSSASPTVNAGGSAAAASDIDSDITTSETWVIAPGRVNIRV